MLRLSRNSMNVNMSTERIPAIHVSGHDKTTEAGVEGHLYEYNTIACLIQRPAPVRGLEPLDAPGSSFTSSLKSLSNFSSACGPEKHS